MVFAALKASMTPGVMAVSVGLLVLAIVVMSLILWKKDKVAARMKVPVAIGLAWAPLLLYVGGHVANVLSHAQPALAGGRRHQHHGGCDCGPTSGGSTNFMEHLED
jgi:hypothetical protein